MIHADQVENDGFLGGLSPLSAFGGNRDSDVARQQMNLEMEE